MSETPPVDLGLSDEDYWDDPFKTRVEIETKLLDEETSALVLGAPSSVAFQSRETLPLLVLRVGTADELARTRFARHALIVAVELGTNTTYVGKGVVRKNPRKKLTDYEGPPLEGWGGEAFAIDLRERLQLPWGRGELLVSTILRDSMTHRVRIKLEKGGYQDPAVDEYLAKTAGDPVHAPISPTPIGQDDGQSLPTYRQRDASPAIPDEQGISLVVPRVLERAESMKAPLHGSFRLPTLPRHVGGGEAEGPPSTATVTITLVLVGSDIPAPFVFPLQVPSYDPVGGSADAPEITGYFSLDLQRLGDLTAMDQTYFIYAFSGEVATGPAPMALVTR